ncbi:MAG: EamA family transporter [Actinomycetota bacterium]
MTRTRAVGYWAISAAAVLWAVGGAYASRLIDEGASFVELTEARAWITALVLLVVVARSRPARSGEGKPPLWLVVAFGLSIAAANLTYYASLSRLPVAVAITIQYTAPGLVVGWTAFAERKGPSRRVAAALIAAVIGVALLAELPAVLASGEVRLDGIGLLIAVASAFAFATYMLTGERVGRSLGAQRSVLQGFLVASALWVVVQSLRGRPDTLLDERFVPGVIFLAVATTIAPFLLFVWGLGRIRASDAGIMSTLEPLTAAVIAFVWLDQSLAGWQLVGAALVIVGIGLVQAERPATEEMLTERAAVD